MATTQIGTFDYTIPAEYFGDFAADFDTAAINSEVLDQLNAMLPEGITIARNGMIFADVDKADIAREINYRELLDQVDATSIVEQHQVTSCTAHEDNAGGVHISNGTSAWFLGFDYLADVAADLAAWQSGEWEPSEDDGLTPETLDAYATSADRTDSKRIA